MNDANAIKVVITKDIAAPVSRVFSAWTEPKMIQQWFAPGHLQVDQTGVDLRVGGEYMIHIHDPEKNEDHIVSGTYEEIVENEVLVFNWMWKDGVDRTRVKIEFEAQEANKTRITLTHTGFSQQEYADHHTQGWGACLEKLLSLF